MSTDSSNYTPIVIDRDALIAYLSAIVRGDATDEIEDWIEAHDVTMDWLH